MLDKNNIYSWIYRAFLSPTDTQIVAEYDESDLSEKGIDKELLEESMLKREQYDGFFWKRTKSSQKREICSGNSINEETQNLSESYKQYFSRVAPQSNSIRDDVSIFKNKYMKELDLYYREKITPLNGTYSYINKNGNICIFKRDEKENIAVFFFDKNEYVPILKAVYHDEKTFNKYNIEENLRSFQQVKQFKYNGGNIEIEIIKGEQRDPELSKKAQKSYWAYRKKYRKKSK